MAPDLNGLDKDGKWDYSTPGAQGYDVPKTDLNDPNNRKIRVVCIGAGVSGILMAYLIQKLTSNVELVIYEKNADLGGTWLENRYPGCACDIPSHAYTFNFALNPDWPRFFSYSPDIHAYLAKVVRVFGLEKYMTYSSEVTGCYWQEDTAQWQVNINRNGKEIVESCDMLLHATGILNNFKWPKLPGMDKFKGRLVHTARWPEDYQKDQWKNDRVAVIGSGASSIQTVPNMQPHTKHLDVFVRTGVWFVQIANNYGANKEYTETERDEFRRNPSALVAHSKDIEDQVNGLWGLFYSDTPEQAGAKEMFTQRMGEFIKDKRLLEGFTPKFGIGCRRVTPGDPYMEAIQEKNVDVHFTAVESITEKGVVGADGVEREADTIVCATGFDVSYKPRFPIVGRNGVDLRKKWEVIPESYLGLACPDMPNFITFVGPTWPVENGSVMGPLQGVGEYAIQLIKKMQNEGVKSWCPRQDVTDSFNEHVQEWIKHTVWKEGCRSWYRNNETGRVNAVWPGSSLHYLHTIRTPRYEDFEIEHANKANQWGWLGMGYTVESRHETLDKSPYINERNIDVKWLESNGIEKGKARELVLEHTAMEARKEAEHLLNLQDAGDGGSAKRNLLLRNL